MEQEKKFKVLRIIAIVVFLIMMSGPCFLLFAQTGTSILDKSAQAFEKSGGVSVSFSMTVAMPGQLGTDRSEGMIEIQGTKFILTTPEIETIFNGTTQWVYMPNADEVNISNPSAEELQLINPALLLKTYKTGFTASYDGESGRTGNRIVQRVTLTPRVKTDIAQVELEIVKETSFPSAMTITTKNGSRTTISIDNVKTGLNKPDSYFVFKKSDFPDAEIIDLR